MINIKDFNVYVANKEIINNFSIACKPNTINAIIGPNGCGKTTLLKGICGLNKTNGSVYLNDSKLDIDTQKHDYLSAFLEGGSYYINMSVYENLNYACLLNQLGKNRINETLALVDFPETHIKTKASKLSLGQRQKLGLAMVLILEKPILLLDEPLNGLDANAVENFNELLLRIKQQTDTTILLTSHLISKLIDIIDTVSILKDGSLAYQCNADEIANLLFIGDKKSKLIDFLFLKNINFKVISHGILINNLSKDNLEELFFKESISNAKISLVENLEATYKLATA